MSACEIVFVRGADGEKQEPVLFDRFLLDRWAR